MNSFASPKLALSSRTPAPGQSWLKRAKPLGLLVVLLCLWQLGSTMLLDAASATLLPPPSAIFRAFWELIEAGDLWRHLRDSLKRELVAFAWSTLSIPLGLAMGYWKSFNEQLDPL